MGNCCAGEELPPARQQKSLRALVDEGKSQTDTHAPPRKHVKASRALMLTPTGSEAGAAAPPPRQSPVRHAPPSPPSMAEADDGLDDTLGMRNVAEAFGEDCSLDDTVSLDSPGKRKLSQTETEAMTATLRSELSRQSPVLMTPFGSDAGTPVGFDVGPLPFPAELITFHTPTVRMLGVTAGWVRDGARKYRIKLHTSNSMDRTEVDRYYIPKDCVLASFAHVRCPRLLPRDVPLSVSCVEDVDLVVALHAENPTCLDMSFTRVITNNSYSRFLASGAKGVAQKWYRLYHRRLPRGAHTIPFLPDAGYQQTAANQLTMFVRPVAHSPPLHLTPIDDDSPAE